MAKIDLPDIGSLANSASARQAINDNFTAIEEAIENTLSRDGTTPNSMEADLDMDGNTILNVADPVADLDAVNKRSVEVLVNEFADQIVENTVFGEMVSESYTATAAQVEFTLPEEPASLNSVEVFVDGVRLYPTSDFSYSGTTLTLVTPLAGGEEVLVRFGAALPTGITNPDSIAYTPPLTGVAGSVKDYLDALQDSVDEDVGATLVSFKDSLGTAYLKTVSDMLNGGPVSVMRFINPAQHAGIRDATGNYDAASDLNTAFVAYKNLVLPAGMFKIGSTLSLPDRLTLMGTGWTVPYNGGSVQEPRGSVIKLLPNSDCDMFRQDSKAYRHSLHLSGFAINGDGANQNNVGNTPDGTYNMYQFNRNAFFFEALYNAVFRDLMVYNMRGAGWALHGDASVGMTNVFLDHCHAYNCRTYSVYGEGTLTDMRISGGDYGFGRIANLRLTSSNTINGAVFWTSQCQDPTDAATHATGTGAVTNAGVVIAGNNNKIIGSRVEGNAGHGVKIIGDDNKLKGTTLYFNSASASTTGLFDGINDAGEDNLYDVEIRQSASSPYALRNAIKLEASHAGTRIIGGDITRIGANAAEVATPVDGFSFTVGDKSDFSWASGEVKAYSAIANSIGTVATKVQFRTETVDIRGEWDTTTDTFTAAETGVYRIDTGVNIANITDGNSFIVAIYKNGSEYRRLGQQRAGAASPIQIVGGLEMKLEAGDTIDIRGTCGTANSTNVGSALTWIEITQL